LAAAFLRGGSRFIQVRAKRLGSGALLDLVGAVLSLARPLGCIVIVNDRVDLAKLAGADGVHVGQDDLPPAEARALLGPEAIIGFSTHTTEQIAAAAAQPISYLAVGPIFGTRTKATGYDAVGVELVRAAVEGARGLPVVAIGGITLETAPAVLAAGASQVAVISDLLVGDPEARVRRYESL
jgi:thiamine-phosphate pyrophosphorylase